MDSPDSSSEFRPIIEILQILAKRGEQNAAKPNFGIPELQMWVNAVRLRLGKLYGKDAPALIAFPAVDNIEGPVHEHLAKRLEHLKRMIETLESVPKITATPIGGKRVFIGHGRSLLWRELKDFIAESLGLPWDEFNREEVAGYTTSERLQKMLSEAAIGFLIMTAEEERTDGTVHARQNVVHEVGLFQGRLGLRRAIVLLEDGCSEFSNITGLSQIRFPQGDIRSRFENIRGVLGREGLV